MRLMTIDAIDVESSFSPTGSGYQTKHIVNRDGEPVLNQKIWEIGVEMYDALHDAEHPDVIENYRNGLTIAEDFANDFLEPLIVELIDKEKLVLSKPTEGSIIDIWRNQTIEAKIINFLEMFEQRVGHLSLMPAGIPNPINQAIASLILLKIDDAAISEFCDGSGLIENIEDIFTLYRHLSKPAYVQAIEKNALRSRARSGAESANAAHKANRDAVFEWLEKNFRPARSSEEMAAEMEQTIKRKFGTILKDITAWKKARKR